MSLSTESTEEEEGGGGGEVCEGEVNVARSVLRFLTSSKAVIALWVQYQGR